MAFLSATLAVLTYSLGVFNCQEGRSLAVTFPMACFRSEDSVSLL